MEPTTKNINKVYTKLTGEAAKPPVAKQCKITGAIDTPNNYLEKLRPDELEKFSRLDSHIAISRTSMDITFNGNKGFTIDTIVKGTIKTNPMLQTFAINEERTFDRKTLERLLRFNKMYLADEGDYARALNVLQDIKIKTEGRHEEVAKHGDKTKVVQQKHDFKELQFNLTMQLFEGIAQVYSFPVIVYADVVSTGVQFYIESIDLPKLIHTEGNKFIDAEIAKLCKHEFAIINE